ncbi:putative malate dehydrogenase 1B [Takifugu rubripes]|uniref:Malate dehydrogenase 1B, NAD (soluble) n=1 Tax=Takifugu rubripes TaxID=31033 RepID=H2TAD4_TAKRU|nr:putative malate dehydrogenase 1B [Takifugu rubripes]
MAMFVLSGKINCPYYAKAELLADKLQNYLPNFRIRKISIPSEKWKEWLEDICRKNGWKHKESPLIWREIVHQGGKGLLLGGFSDFLEHCQIYYNVTSDMPADIMVQIAEENLEAHKQLLAEAQHRANLVRHIWISSALSSTSQFLMSSLISADVFPNISTIDVHLLDLDGDEEVLHHLKNELEHQALHLLHQVTIHTDLEQAFQKADVIILLDEPWCDDIATVDERELKKQKIDAISERYREYGRLIDTQTKKEVKVIVSGESFVNLRCSLLLDYTHSIHSHQIVALATQLENEARAIVAKKLNVRPADVRDVIVWGNISGSFYVDLQKTKVFNYDGPVKGPEFFSLPAQNIINDRTWIETDFQELVRSRRAAVVSRMNRTTAMSCSHGILTVLKAWNGLGAGNEVFSLGVLCSGYHDLPDGVVLSVPLTFTDGKWSALSDVTIGVDLKERLQHSANEIGQFLTAKSNKDCSR